MVEVVEKEEVEVVANGSHSAQRGETKRASGRVGEWMKGDY